MFTHERERYAHCDSQSRKKTRLKRFDAYAIVYPAKKMVGHSGLTDSKHAGGMPWNQPGMSEESAVSVKEKTLG